MTRPVLALVLSLAVTGAAGGALAAPAGNLEGYVPVAAHGPGEQGSQWTTDLWIYRQDASVLHLWFNPSGHDNTSEESVVVPLSATETFLPDVVAATFHTTGSGSLHYLADGPVVVVSRTWTPGPQGGTYGQTIYGIPVSEASTPEAGQAGALRVQLNRSAGFRANFGVVNVSGNPLTVTVDVYTAEGQPAPGTSALAVTLQPYDMKQLNKILDAVTAPAGAPLLVRAAVSSGSGGILAYLSQVDDVTNSGTYQAAFRFGS